MKNEEFKDEEYNELSSEEKSLFLQKKIMKSGLFHDNPGITFGGYEKIFIDLDSLLSRLISEELPLNDSIRLHLLDYVMECFIEFFSIYSDVANILIFYGFKRNKIFDDIYPDWNKDRYKRFENETVIDFVKNKLLKKLKLYSKKVTNVTVVDYKDSFITDIFSVLNIFEIHNNVLIISRNPQMLCLLSYFNLSIYDGKEIVNRKTYSLIKGNPTVHYSLIPHWFLLRGDKRNGYIGYPRMGPKTTDNYIQKHKEKIISFEDERIKTVEKYKKLYFLK